jgi:catechol 2,3-dioxygenase
MRLLAARCRAAAAGSPVPGCAHLHCDLTSATMEAATPPAPLAPAEVTLSVADLDRAVGYYERSIGLHTNDRSNGTARLGVPGRDLVVLEEQPGARPVRGGHTGLFHLALLVPSRLDLAAWLAHAAARALRSPARPTIT